MKKAKDTKEALEVIARELVKIGAELNSSSNSDDYDEDEDFPNENDFANSDEGCDEYEKACDIYEKLKEEQKYDDLNEDMKKVEEYAKDNGIPFNLDLSKQMLITLHNGHPYWDSSRAGC